MMWTFLIGSLTLATMCKGQYNHVVDVLSSFNNKMEPVAESSVKGDMVMSFVVFRHGDRTPDQQELDKLPVANLNESVFFPFGTGALTIKGKQRGFMVGKYLRKRYNSLISSLYLSNEIYIRTTNYPRTKMTALSALSALYPPTDVQKWNPHLNWQPIPYDSMHFLNDDLAVFGNCPRYLALKRSVYNEPEVKNMLDSYSDLFTFLSVKTGKIVTMPEDVFVLSNLFQAMKNADVEIPQWAEDVMPRIKEITNIEYSCLFHNNELIRLATGVLLSEFVNATKLTIAEDKSQPKLRLYSAHENNVAGLLAAMRVFKPHRPNYGSSASLELRKDVANGKYGVSIVYAEEAEGPGVTLPVEECGGPICDYNTFVRITQDLLMTRDEYKKQCYTPLR